MSKLKYSYDLRDVDAELSRLGKGLDATTLAKLDGRLEQLFQETQAKVHVITGSLKLSGKRRTYPTAYRWRGTITYGGSSQGPINPVRYAVYENAREGVRRQPPGTLHRFFTLDTRTAFRGVEEAIADFLDGDGRQAKFKKRSKGSRRGKSRW